MKYFHKSAALLLSAALLFSASVLSGCDRTGSGDDATKNPVSDQSEPAGKPIYAPKIPDNPIDESVAGNDTAASIGTAADYDGKVSMTVHNVTELDAKSSTGGRIFVAEMTITNHSSEPIDCSTGTHFSLDVDGEVSYMPVIDVAAAIYSRQYYVSINKESYMNFNQEIAAGASVDGYVAFKTPASFENLTLIYTPYKYYSNDTISCAIADSDITHYKNTFGPASN